MPLTQAEIDARLKKKFGTKSGRIGGKGAVRRKYKAAPKAVEKDDKKLSAQLKRLSVTPIPAIEEVNLFKDDGTVVHFTKPKVQAELSSHTYVVTGTHEVKKLDELIPEILPQLGRESFDQLKSFASQLPPLGDDSVPTLIDDDLNFEEIAKSDEKMELEATEASEATESSDKTAAENEDETVAKDETVVEEATATEAPADATEATEASELTEDTEAKDATEADTPVIEEAPKTSLEPDTGAAVPV